MVFECNLMRRINSQEYISYVCLTRRFGAQLHISQGTNIEYNLYELLHRLFILSSTLLLFRES